MTIQKRQARADRHCAKSTRASRGMRTKQTGALLINLALIFLVIALYTATSEPDAAAVMANVAYMPKYRGNAEGKIALEIAVDWNAAALPGMLDTLREKGVRATFAVSGEWARENPDMLLRIADEGHELATMGMSPGEDGGIEFVTEDVKSSVRAVENISGSDVRLYYAGTRNLTVSKNAAAELDLTLLLSTVDLLCGRGSAEDIITRALRGPIEGSIILMQPTAAAGEALGRLIDEYKTKGITLVRVSDVLNE